MFAFSSWPSWTIAAAPIGRAAVGRRRRPVWSSRSWRKCLLDLFCTTSSCRQDRARDEARSIKAEPRPRPEQQTRTQRDPVREHDRDDKRVWRRRRQRPSVGHTHTHTHSDCAIKSPVEDDRRAPTRDNYQHRAKCVCVCASARVCCLSRSGQYANWRICSQFRDLLASEREVSREEEQRELYCLESQSLESHLAYKSNKSSGPSSSQPLAQQQSKMMMMITIIKSCAKANNN